MWSTYQHISTHLRTRDITQVQPDTYEGLQEE